MNIESIESQKEDERLTKPDRCRVTTMVGSIEFICIRKVHAKVYNRVRSTPVGAPIFENNPSVDRHYFVRRYPMGEH